jgi:hypothetical protein
MSLMASIALIGFVPLSVVIFSLMPARRALLSCYIAGWLFLPNSGFDFSGIPDYNKQAAIALGATLGVFIFDVGKLTQFRPSILDLPMTIFCLWPMFSYLNQGHGPETGLNWVIFHLTLWGFPYLFGRLYFGDHEALRELAIGVFVGGLVYAPLCWLEVRISPQVSRMVYGQGLMTLTQHIRYGGYRPVLFMQHGLMVALWMASSTVVGFWLWRCKTITKIWNLPMNFLVPLMFATTIFACKSGNGFFALLLGVASYVVGSVTKSSLFILILALIPPSYIFLRSTGSWSGDNLIALVETFDKERAGSLNIRMVQEDLYTQNARRQFVFGWAGPGMIPRDESGQKLTRGNDGFWIITFSMYGIVSLASIFAVLTVAPTAWAIGQEMRFPGAVGGPGAALALMIVIFAFDCLANGMIIPIFSIAAGALIKPVQFESLSEP